MTDKNRPVYMIGIAAELVEMHPQTLRLYEREELVVPQRTAKDTRLYSENDIELLKEIQEMTQKLGLNLAGVKLILQMKKEVVKAEEEFQKTIDDANKEIDEAHERMKLMRKQMEDEIEEIKKSFRHDIVLYKRPYLVKGDK